MKANIGIKTDNNVKSHATVPAASTSKKQAIQDTTIRGDGRITLPGIRAGLSSLDYQPLVELYQSIQEAREFLAPNYERLRGEGIETGHPNWITPLTQSRLLKNLFYKREDLTSTRAYKVRGAVVSMSHAMENKKNGEKGFQKFLTVSTGNHALGVLKAAEILRPEQVRVAIPTNTPEVKLNRMKAAMDLLNETGVKAEIVVFGSVFDETRAWASSQENPGEFYIDPYADPWVVAGQGSIGMELCEQLAPYLEAHPEIHELIVITPVGGGGLLTGTATALRLSAVWESAFKNVSPHFMGMRLYDCYGSKLGDAIRVKHIADNNRHMFSKLGIPTLELDDEQLKAGQDFILQDIDALVEGASASTVYPPIMFDNYHPTKTRLVVCLISGGNI